MLIKQDYYIDENKLNCILTKIGATKLPINTQLILNDIEKIKQKQYDYTKRDFKQKESYKMQSIAYLENIAKSAKNNKLTLFWQSVQNKIISNPFELHRITEFKVLTTDYINIEENEKMLYFDLSNLMKIIAFSIMHREFDETFESIEEKLSDIGIITSYPESIILDIIPEDILDLANVYMVSDSPYLGESGKDINSYYLNKQFDAKYYKDVCEYSFNYTVEIVLMEVLNYIIKNNIKFKLCGVFDTGFYILVPRETEFNINSIFEQPITVRAFGRKFEVENRLRVY